MSTWSSKHAKQAPIVLSTNLWATLASLFLFFVVLCLLFTDFPETTDGIGGSQGPGSLKEQQLVRNKYKFAPKGPHGISTFPRFEEVAEPDDIPVVVPTSAAVHSPYIRSAPILSELSARDADINPGNDAGVGAGGGSAVAFSPTMEPSERTIESKKAIDSSGVMRALTADTVLLIICANRADYLKRSLYHVLKHHPRGGLPLFISQDGKNKQVKQVIDDFRRQFAEAHIPVVHRQHEGSPSRPAGENGYFKLCAHYKWALSQVFELDIARVLRDGGVVEPGSGAGGQRVGQREGGEEKEVHRVIILEEDLEIAPDFFEYFAASASLLDDETENLLAISAWNDNGMGHLVQDNKFIYRSDFFPGLGWMMHRRVWQELSIKWPRAYWDDWLREPAQRKGRHILHPEVCRTLHFGNERGVSNAQYSQYLNSIKLNDEFVAFTEMDLSYLRLRNWDSFYLGAVQKAQQLPWERRNDLNLSRYSEVRIAYTGFEGPGRSFSGVAKWSGAMDNIKAGVPRTAYKGVVTVWKDGVRVHLVPAQLWG